MDAWLRVDGLWEFNYLELLSRKACDILLKILQNADAKFRRHVTHTKRKQSRDIKKDVEGSCSSNN